MIDAAQAAKQTAESGGASAQPAAAAVRDNVLALLRAEPNAALGQPIPMPRIGGEPPKEFRAFKWGDNPTTKGLLKLTPEGVKLIMEEIRRRGVALCFDYFHATYNPAAPADSRKAAGQTVPEVRPDGIWYGNIQWTPAADKAIRDGEWPYISPGVLHSKDGVITALKNPGLVTDPGIIGAVPTVLSGTACEAHPLFREWTAQFSAALSGPPSKGPSSMADKKRMTLDAYAAVQTALKRCQALGDTDGPEKDMATKAVGHLATLADLFSGFMGPAGMMDDAVMMSSKEAGKDRMMAALSAELGESDPDKLYGKLLLRLDGTNKAPAAPEGSVLLSKEDAAATTKLLLDGHDAKVPTTRRAALEAAPLGTVISFLSSAQNITPPATHVREAPPAAPTSEAVKEAMKQNNQGGSPITQGASGKSYAQLDGATRARIDEIVAVERKLQPSAFNEQTARESAMTLLSDYEPPSDAVTRHMPACGADFGHPMVEAR